MLRRAYAVAQQSPPVRYDPVTIPASYLGWNTRDALDAQDPRFATLLDNWFVFNGYIQLRGGSRIWSTVDAGVPVETLMRWRAGGLNTILAAAGDKVFRTTQGGAPTTLGTGFTTAQWQWSTGGRAASVPSTFMVNGADTPQYYDGTTLAPCTWAAAAGEPALTLSNLNNILIAKDLLFLIENDRLGFWYSNKGAVGPTGDLKYFPLEGVLQDGGELVAMGMMTVDGGNGPDDYFCAIASTGWAVVYAGENPGQADQWAIKGRYKLGTPIGPRSAVQIAGDLAFITSNGFTSMAQFIRVGGATQQSFLFNNNIQPTVVQQTLAYGNLFGWSAVLHPSLTVMLFNVPQPQGRFVQYILNTELGAWSSLSGYNGLCWLSNDAQILFGDAEGRVIEAAFGGVDVGDKPVVGRALTAFSQYGNRGVGKKVNIYRPIIRLTGSTAVSIATSIQTDYDTSLNLTTQLPTAGGNPGIWDVSEWNAADWVGAEQYLQDWYGSDARGHSLAFGLQVESRADSLRWYSTDLTFTAGTAI